MTLQDTTPEQTLQYLREAVAERGSDYVYPDEWKMIQHGENQPSMCRYVAPDGSGPACIAGVVLHKYGVSLETLAKHETQAVWRISEQMGMDYISRQVIQSAQTTQDGGRTWGAALVEAETMLELETKFRADQVRVD